MVLDDTGFYGGYFDGDILFLSQIATLQVIKLNENVSTSCGEKLYEASLNGNATSLGVYDGLSICAIGSGFQILNTKRKEASSILYRDKSIGASAVCVQGDKVFLGKSSNIVSVYSFTNPSSPVLLGSSGMTGSIYEMRVSGEYVYVSGSVSGVYGIFIFDVSDPVSINHVGTVDLGFSVAGFEIYGDILAITSSGLVDLLDISDPENILHLSKTRASTESGDIGISGAYLYAGAADSGHGLKIYDISNPVHPILIREEGSLYINQLSISGNMLYVYSSEDDEELRRIDITDPFNPTLYPAISCIMNGGTDELFASGLASSGNYIFFHGWPDGDNYDDDGVQIFNTENSDVADRIEFLDLYDHSEPDWEQAGEGQIALNGNYLYIAAGDFICIDIAP